MPPRYAYWTILAGGLPTAFRASKREELLPTFKRIQDKHPDAEMKWFARGRLWNSPEESQTRQRAPHDPHWRPGGDHRDPRQPFIDAKKARNQDRRRKRWQDAQGRSDAKASSERPHADPLRSQVRGSKQPFKSTMAASRENMDPSGERRASRANRPPTSGRGRGRH